MSPKITRPVSGLTWPQMTSSKVVLPAPFGPMSARAPQIDVQIHPQGLEAIEGDRDTLQVDDGPMLCHAMPPLPGGHGTSMLPLTRQTRTDSGWWEGRRREAPPSQPTPPALELAGRPGQAVGKHHDDADEQSPWMIGHHSG